MKRSIFAVLVAGLILTSGLEAMGDTGGTEEGRCLSSCAYYRTGCSIGRAKICDEKLCRVAAADCRSSCRAEERSRQALEKSENANTRAILLSRQLLYVEYDGKLFRVLRALDREATVLHKRYMRAHEQAIKAMDKASKSKERLHEAWVEGMHVQMRAIDVKLKLQKEAIAATEEATEAINEATEVIEAGNRILQAKEESKGTSPLTLPAPAPEVQ